MSEDSKAGDLRLPREWEVIDRLKVVDPDGWSHGSYRSWGEPISREEWERRIATSTIDVSQRYTLSGRQGES